MQCSIRIRFSCVFFLTALCSLQAVSLADDWTRWRGTNESGVATESLPIKPKLDNIIWKAELGIGFSSFCVADGKVYTMGHDGKKRDGIETVWCFDAETGKEIWKDSYSAPLHDRFYEGGPGSSPTKFGDNIYTYSKHGHVHCYDAETGKRQWERDMVAEAGLDKLPEWGFACSPYFTNGSLIVEAGNTFALDPATGKVLWKSQAFTPAYGNPKEIKIGDRNMIAVLKTEGLVIVDQADGKVVATEPWKTRFATNATTPIVAGNEIFISTGYERGCALLEFDGKTLTKRYENKSMCNHMNNCVLIDGHLYGFDGNAHMGRPTEFVCIEWKTGKEKWRADEGEGLGCGSLIADAAGTMIILTERGELVTANASPDGFKETGREQVLGGRSWTPPAFANGKIYCRNSKGDMVCVAVGE